MDKKELIQLFDDEGDSAYIYRAVAKKTKNSKAYLELADKEIEHQTIFAKMLKDEHKITPNYRPSMKARLMVYFVSLGFTNEVLRLRISDEAQEVSGYLQRAKTYKQFKTVAKDEADHAITLQKMLGHSTVEPWHHHESGGTIRDVIYGFNDGLTANFGLIMGVIGSNIGHNAVILSGVAGLLANFLSMGSSSYLGAVSEKELYDHEIDLEKLEMQLMPEEETEELSLIYQAKGFSKAKADRIAEDIMNGDQDIALQEKVKEELGITGDTGSPFKAGISTGLATFVGSLIPLVPLFFGNSVWHIFAAFTIAMFFHFVVGGVRSVFTGRGFIRSGIDMFLVGLGVAIIGYVIGYLLTGTVSH